jgi:GNAT superfamily N-acetyltransferase
MRMTSTDSLPATATIRPLVPSDIPGAMRLCRAAGWNQLPGDWERLLAIEPEGCFALDCGGQLASTTTAVCYGRDLAWIGMVLTAPEFRRRGFAEQLMRVALEYTERRGVAVVKLDATEMGGGLYRKLGFVEECPIERWQRPPGPIEGGRVDAYCSDPGYDQKRFGADRAALLSQLAPLGSASIRGRGYAMGRAGALAAYFGPCVADLGAAEPLLRWFLAEHQGESIFWDLLPGNKEAVRLAEDFDFIPRRHLLRMCRSSTPAPPSDHREVFAIAGFEFG